MTKLLQKFKTQTDNGGKEQFQFLWKVEVKEQC